MGEKELWANTRCKSSVVKKWKTHDWLTTKKKNFDWSPFCFIISHSHCLSQNFKNIFILQWNKEMLHRYPAFVLNASVIILHKSLP